MAKQMAYGYFHGGDPRKFYPDYESCSLEELENHKRACDLWNAAEKAGNALPPEPNPSMSVHNQVGQCVLHITKAPFGVGMYEFDDGN